MNTRLAFLFLGCLASLPVVARRASLAPAGAIGRGREAGLRVFAGWSRETDQAVPAQPAAHFGARTEAVLVDVTVTDRKGRPVTNLTKADFEVYEDNTLQTILTFEHHAPNPAATVKAAAAAAGLSRTGGAIPGSPGSKDSQGPSVTALAFDRLSPEGRMLAYRAAERFVQTKQADELAGVFVVDQALTTVAPYTTDAGVLGAAVKRVAETATSQLARERNGALDQMHVSSETPMVASAAEQGRGDGDLPHVDPVQRVAGTDRGLAAVMEMMLRMERSYDDMLYEMQGNASINALLALVDSLGEVPGRKSLIYFCEGLTIPPSVEPRFRAVIHTANRSNVTVYTVDATGLRVHSEQAETAQAIQEYGAMGVGDVERRGKFLDALEDNERTLTRDPAVSLGILADQTGGLLINNTNDLEDGISRIDDDRRNYYLVSYSPTNPTFDGRFHRIAVKLKKDGLLVRARSGYVAAPMTEAAPVFDYELPALDALSRTPPPSAFPFSMTPLSVPVPGRPGQAVLAVTVPGGSLSLLGNAKTQEYAGGAVIVARVVDAKGTVVRKLSQQYRLHGALADAQTVRAKTLSFTRTPDLAPGTYHVDVVVFDSASEHASVVGRPLVIPEPHVPMVGDLMIVDHAERLPPDLPDTSSNPLVVNGLLLRPSSDAKVHRGAQAAANFGLPLALAPGAAAPPIVLALLSASGEVLASVPLPAAEPEASGRLLAIGRMPLDRIPAGTYQLQVTVGTGATTEVRKAALTVVE